MGAMLVVPLAFVAIGLASPPVGWFFAGLGLLFVLAMLGAIVADLITRDACMSHPKASGLPGSTGAAKFRVRR